MKHPNPKLFVVILGDLGERCFDSLDSRFPALQNGAQAFLFVSASGNGVDILNASQWASHRGQEHLTACFDCGDESVALGAACTVARPFTSRGYEIEPVWIRGKIEKPKRIKSFSVVATQEVAQEAAILIASLRTFHADPIFVFCDEDAKTLIKSHNFGGVEFKTEADEKTLAAHSDRLAGKVAAKNSFHRVDCIAAKMDAWQWAIDEAYSLTLILLPSQTSTAGCGARLFCRPIIMACRSWNPRATLEFLTRVISGATSQTHQKFGAKSTRASLGFSSRRA